MSVSKNEYVVTIVGLACFAGLVSPTSAQTSDSSGWSITPYIWATDTGVDLTFRDSNIGSGNVKFKDALDVLDAAFMVHVEGGKGNWSAFGDLTYKKTSDTTARTLFTIDAENEEVILDAAVAYWPGGSGSPFSVFGGLRYTGFDDRYDFRLALDGSLVGSQVSNDDFYDALFGLRYHFELSERWALLTHGDLSFGDSEGTLLLRANFAYTVGKRQQNRILFGYQYKEAEFKDGDLITSFTYHGPMAGFNFRF